MVIRGATDNSVSIPGGHVCKLVGLCKQCRNEHPFADKCRVLKGSTDLNLECRSEYSSVGTESDNQSNITYVKRL